MPEPVLKEDHGGFLSKIFKDRFSEALLKKIGLNDRQMKAVEYVKQNIAISNSDYQQLNDIGKTTATEELALLVELRIFKAPTEKGRGAKYLLV